MIKKLTKEEILKLSPLERFDYAAALDREHNRGCAEITLMMKNKYPFLDNIYVQRILSDEGFGVWVFYETEAQSKGFRASGFENEFIKELKSTIQEIRPEIEAEAVYISITFDSCENVSLNYDGDYYARMR